MPLLRHHLARFSARSSTINSNRISPLCEPSHGAKSGLIDYLYYEIITFTTVGYGDIIPSTAQGKLLAICTALLGATHGVTFVALVLQALTQHPPAKTQE